ncbi:MAG: heavy metal translocating P-type ATPase [Candidatus Saccharimonadales bacterium]
MKSLGKFLRRYKLFYFAVLGLLAGLALQFSGYSTASHWVLATVAIIELMPLLYGMLADLRSGKYGIDILAATAIVSAVLLHEYWAAIVVVLMLTGGESLEDYAEHRSRAELDSLLKRAPSRAHVLRARKIVDVKVNELRVGDKIVIKPGELVPVDAVILEGVSSFDESSITGESLPRERGVGEQLVSGSLNNDGAITAKVTASAEDSQYQQIIRLVRAASQTEAPFVRLADRYSIPFTVLSYAIASAVWIYTGEAIRFLEVIIVATPCPLLLAAPIALISGMSRASRYGIIVRNGSALERLAEAQTIAFDKTGTLTSGQLKVSGVTPYNGYSQQEVLSLAASLEQSSTHVLAQAIVAGAQAQQLKLSKTKHVSEQAGRGVSAHIHGKDVLVGRLSLLEERGIIMPKAFKSASVNQTAAYVAIGSQLAGVILLEDSIRPESVSTLAMLSYLGIKHTLMLTGDNKVTAAAVAKSLNITTYHADMLPADKLHTLEAIKHRPLVFVGDGVNDAPALTASDVGIALGARGSTAASESADIVIMTDDLGRVATAVSIAQRTFKIARQSILIGIGLSFVLMAAFATGKFSPLTGAILQEVVDVVVIFNALRAHLSRGEVA